MAAGHQPGLATEPVGKRHMGHSLPVQPALQGQLLAGIAIAVQQGHGNTAVALCQGPPQRGRQLAIEAQGQGFELGAIGRQPPRHLQGPHPQRPGPADLERKDVWPVLVADGQQIGKPPVDQQQHRLAAPLQQGVGGHGGAEAQLRDQTRRDRLISIELVAIQSQQLADGGHRRIAGQARLHRQHLAHHQLAVARATDDVGEGAAPIDPEAPARSPAQGFVSANPWALNHPLALNHRRALQAGIRIQLNSSARPSAAPQRRGSVPLRGVKPQARMP